MPSSPPSPKRVCPWKSTRIGWLSPATDQPPARPESQTLRWQDKESWDVAELDGQVAIVTGAGRGIGRAIALELAGLGADVVVAEVEQAAAERTVAEVEQNGRRGLALRVDVTNREDRQAMVGETLRKFSRIDILVNNAGIY